MGKSVKLKLSGFRELERAMAEELPKATAKAVLRRTAVNAMEPVRLGMEARAPKDKRKLAGGMKTRNAKAERIPGTKRYAKQSGVSVNTGPTTGPVEGGNPAWQEFGTVDMPAHPYARPTADAEGMNVIAQVREELTAQIDKAKARIAKKAAKAKG
ncbi:HK97-gp10 family putative phage morphogenesis protein [uncultured Novosphingobium sp.]|uniref:HK97-gp10 family putative phage morphogenesis protein n=1 Tax=uncultured Novosphingobium sp. TaxID=292277 RepID=UPI00258D442E|nr:HK97-gp10 family putative phage morphogenesis protein [uncultured Novosphingobium sp.]